MRVWTYQGGNHDPREMIAVLSVCGNPIFTMAACCGEWAAPGSQVPESLWQSCWSHKNLEGLGFCLRLLPVFRELPEDRAST